MAEAALRSQAERTVLSRVDGACHIISLNRPERLNAFNMDVHRDMKIALDAAESDSSLPCRHSDGCRPWLLRGAGFVQHAAAGRRHGA